MLPIILKFVLIQIHLGVIQSELVNIALNKATTTMSSGVETNNGQEAVDGNVTNINCTSLVTTSNEVAWLRIDLELTVKVHTIVIHPSSQLEAFNTSTRTQVYVSQRPEITSRPGDEDLCSLVINTMTTSLKATCRSMGRFVFVRNTHSIYLCEVQVYVCTNGSYGPDCLQRCGYCGGGSCDAETGVCGAGGCLDGYSGSNCNIHRPYSGMSAPVAGVIGAVIMLLLIIAVVAAVFFFFYCKARRNTSSAATISRRHSEDRVNNNRHQSILSRSYVRLTSLFRTSRDPVVDVHQTRRKSIDRRSTQDPSRNNVYVRRKSVTEESGAVPSEADANKGGTTDDPAEQPGVGNSAFEDEDPNMYEVPLPDPSNESESEYFAMGGANPADPAEQVYENQGAEPDEEDQPVYEAMSIAGNKGSELTLDIQSVPEDTDHPNVDGEC